MNYTDILSECRLVLIYLGNTCNFNCSYCDRDYIENSIGNQGFSKSNVDNIENFFTKLFEDSQLGISRIGFHGGEPFLYVKRMDQVLDRIKPLLDHHNLQVVITTNASLIPENQWFLEKWAKYLNLTISYDFIFQVENRDVVDIDLVGDICNRLQIPIMWQFVMPITDPRVFSLELAQDIIDKTKYSTKRMVNLIPLRHHRGEDKFKDFFNEIDLYKFSEDFIRFINVLYNYGVHVLIDGAYKKVDKNYSGKHYKIILSPDGYVYPEFDFCEYQTPEFRVGKWYDNQTVKVSGRNDLDFHPVFYDPNSNNEDSLIHNKCVTCPVRAECGIKYLYKMFDHQPGSRCVLFYEIINNIVDYSTKLNTRNNFYSWVSPKMTASSEKFEPLAKFVPNSPDHKSHFIKEDNIFAAKQELIFSMFRRYNCFAGCHICYVDKHFEKDKSEFSRFIPTEISQEMTDRWLKIFDGYHVCTANDDLYYLKTNHPNLFRWYQAHSEAFYFGSVTDNAFVRAYDIFMNDINTPYGIYEVTFSDVWLTKVNFKKIIDKLGKLCNRFPIKFVKYIVTNPESLEWTTTRELRAFLDANNIQIVIHNDILRKETAVISNTIQNLSFASYNGDIFTICGEGDYLQYDSFFLTQVDAIDPTVTPYDVVDEDFTFTRHLSRHLKGKQEVYSRFSNKLKFSSNQYNIKFNDYYKFIVNKMSVNDDYSYIPDVSIKSYEKLYHKLIGEGWQATPLGLLNLDRNPNVVPLFQFKE